MLMSALQPLVARDVSKSYADRVVLPGVDLTATPGHPVGLVGENGAGKSTLIRILVGAEAADGGTVSRPTDLGYLSQELGFPTTWTVADVLADALAPLHDAVRRLESLAAQLDDAEHASAAHQYAETLEWVEHHDAWDADRRAEAAAARLGLDRIPADRQVARLSGGERTRLALAALITRQPECVVLDEPTNHLDEAAMSFVEEFLVGLPGVVAVASHDRVFLDRVASVVVDLDDSHIGVDGQGGRRFGGGYTSYLQHTRDARRRWEEAFEAQRDQLNDLRLATRTTARQVAHNRPPRDNDKFIYHMKGSNVQATVRRRVRNAEQRIAAIERDLVPKPPALLSFGQPLTGSGSSTGWVRIRELEVEGRLRLARLDVPAGGHLLVTGANGSGKSTLLRVMAGRLEPTAGEVQVSAQRVAYLPQEVVFSRPERTARAVYADLAGPATPSLRELGLVNGRDLARRVGELSVGQQRRLALAVVVARRPDLLLLDEPTNHISLTLADELEEALGRSPGTVVVASHDRWLRDRWPGPQVHLS
jgi:macrolide transport system ATP-binding/permease protein